MSFERGLRLCFLGCVLALTNFAATPTAPDSLDRILDELQQVERISQVSISPDGRWITWNQQRGEKSGNELFILDSQHPGSAPRKIAIPDGTAETRNERVAWSPDSSRFAFFSSPNRGAQDQIFQATTADFAPQKVSSLDGYVEHLKWSPDGQELSFLYSEKGGGGGPLMAQVARLNEVDEQLHNLRIATMRAGGGDIRQVSPADLNVYEYDWSPDGKQFAAIAAPGPADNNWWIAKLYTLTLADRQLHTLYTPSHQEQIAIPRWSPDGARVAFIQGLMSDEGSIGGDIFVISAAGGAARDFTEGAKFSASSLEWQNGHDLLFTAAVKGGGSINRLDVSTGKSDVIWKGDEAVHNDGDYPNLALASNGMQSAVVRSDWEHAPEVWAGPPGQWHQTTNLNAAQRPHWGKSESITWTNDTYSVQGWLLYPEHYDPNQRYPMVVSIHGGPSSERSASWPTTNFDMSVLSAFGYFVFFPNPRGSYGAGEAFTRANVKDFGGGDLKDVLAGVDAVLKRVPVDETRLGITGWSYGGFMTMWTVTQTNRFRAAVAGAGIANWVSYYGENTIDQWMIPFFGASVYDDPSAYAKSTPITYIKRVKTPTLILVGERDAECPAPQSFEFWHALRALGVPTRLVVYPGEGHAFRDPKHNLDRLRRSIMWFDQYLNNAGS